MIRWLTRILSVVLIVLVVAFGGALLLSRLPLNQASSDPIPRSTDPNINRDLEPIEDDIPVNTIEAIPTLQSSRRQTIMVMGIDQRNSADAYTLTDSILLLTIEPSQQSASLLSIPRDLYVEIPNFGKHRINAAYTLGAREGGQLGGAELAMQTIESNLGIQVDHYALLNFQTVINVIDAIGGVTVLVPETIDDPSYPDMNYGFDPFYIEAGEHLMDGETALKYMRSRHGSDDFNRSQRQQQVILAFRDEILSQRDSGILQVAPVLIEKFRDGFFTDLTTADIIAFANASTDLSSFRISSNVLNYDYVRSQATETQGTVLVLKPEEVSELLRQLFY